MKRWRIERSSLVVRAIIIVHYSWTKIGSQTSRAHMHAYRLFEQEAPPEPIYTYTQERLCFPSPHVPANSEVGKQQRPPLAPSKHLHHSLAPSIPQPLSDRGRRSQTHSSLATATGAVSRITAGAGCCCFTVVRQVARRNELVVVTAATATTLLLVVVSA